MLTQGKRREFKAASCRRRHPRRGRPAVCPAVGAEGFPPHVIAGS